MPKTRSRRVVNKQKYYRIVDDDDDDDVQVEAPQNYGGILAALNNNNNATDNNGNDTDDLESNHEKNHTATTTTTPVKSSKPLHGSRNGRPRKSPITSGSDAGENSMPRENKNKKKPTPNNSNSNELTPPPKSVVIGTLPCFSPPTHHPSQHYGNGLYEDENKTPSHHHHHHNDDVSALSCIVSPPAKKQPAKSKQQQRQVSVHRSDDTWTSERDRSNADCEPSDVGSMSSSDADGDSESEEHDDDDDDDDDDGKTVPTAGAGDARGPDPDETFFEEDSLEEQERVEDDEGEHSEDSEDDEDDEEEEDGDSNDELLNDPEDDDSSESEEEMEDDDEEEEEEYTPDDDEFVPEDDEDLSTQDELEDVVEEKPLTRRGRQRKQASPTKPTKAKTGNQKVPTKKGQQKQKQKQPESPVYDHEMSMDAQSPMDQDINMDTEVEVTPMIKPRNSREASVEEERKEQTPVAVNRSLEKSFNASSPESLVVVVCDDDDDDDVDVLEATILDDEAYSVASAKSPKSINMSQAVSDSDEEEENENDVGLIADEDEQSYEADEETVAFGVDMDEEPVARRNPVDNLDDESVKDIEPVASAKSPESIDMPQAASDNDEEEENENDVALIVDEDEQSYEADEETVAFEVDLDEEPVAQRNPVDVATNLDDESVQEIEPIDEAVDETATMFALVNLDNERDEESEPVDVSVNLDNEAAKESEPAGSVQVDVSVNPESEPIEENKLVDASLDLESESVKENEESEPVYVSANLDNEPVDETEESKPVDVSANFDAEHVDDNESVDAARDETVPKFVLVRIVDHAANESEPVDVAAEEIGCESINVPVKEDEWLCEASDPMLNLEGLDDVEESKSRESADDAVSENNENRIANDKDGPHQNVEEGTPTKSRPKESKISKPKKSYHRHEGVVKRGKWTLGAKLGVGSFGVVHIGMDTMTGTLMAVKTFQMERAVMKDVRREVELLRSLKHKNIVRYYGAEMDKTHLHIFQEWVPAGCVSSMLCRFGCFAMPVIRSYLSQALSGLNYLHENHILHRDIKGSNLLVNDEGIVKLADFGASKRLANLQADLMMSMTVRGTPYFMAPEVFEEKYSSKADIWGIGCVAYQMTTGSPPWKEQGLSNPISLFNYIKRQNGAPSITYPGDAEQLSEGEKHVRTLFEAFMEKCYHQDPSKRPTARALLEDPFFTEVHHELDEEQTPCRGLFSPSSETSSRDGHPSPAFSPPFLGSPSPTKQSQSRSVVKWKQSFRSPPKPKRKTTIGSPSPIRASPMRTARSPIPRSPYRPTSASKGSPSTDTSDWPTWARERHLALKKEQSTSQGTQQITDLLDSLAWSEDSNSTYGQNPFRRTSATNGKTAEGSTMLSNLGGLKLLDQSDATYEL